MGAVESTRISELDKSVTRTIGGVVCVVAPVGTRLGAFTKRLSKICATPEEAVAQAVERGVGGDKLLCRSVRQSGGVEGWQVLQRRNKVGGPNRVAVHHEGSHPQSRNAGVGEWFVVEG